MNRTTAVEAIIAATSKTHPVVFTTDATCRIARVVDDRPNHFYLTAATGLAGSLGIGIALETRRPTVIVDSYSNLVRNPVGLLTAGTMGELPLIHIVLDDSLSGAGTVGAAPSDRTDILALARASGYGYVATTAMASRFTAVIESRLADCAEPVFLRAVLTDPETPVPGMVDADPIVHARRFNSHLNVLKINEQAA